VSAEIERTEAANDLQALNASLEAQVSRRTQELEEAMQSLKDTMSALTEQAKMASLGQLVAGISHEVNTPLGVAILANSVATNHAQTILEKIEAGKLSKSMLVSLSEDIVAGNESVQHNLHRAAELISSFKQVSIDKNIDHMAGVDLSFSLEALVKSLQPETEKRKISLQINCPLTCIVRTWPSDITQVASNIIMNSLVHGFPQGHLGSGQAKIAVELTQREDVITLVITDNGIGMSEAVIKNIFDPFFTTKRGSGGTGLGLNIVYNIVKEKLEGELEVESEVGVGSRFRVEFKAEKLENVTQG
jgi:signal transduction histidine kinase